MKVIQKKFINKPEESLTVAIITSCEDTRQETGRKCPQKVQKVTETLHTLTNAMDGDEMQFKGVSRCYPTDEYSQHRGEDLASTRADLKFHNRMSKDYDKYIEVLETAIEHYKKLKERHDVKAEHIVHDIERYYKETV